MIWSAPSFATGPPSFGPVMVGVAVGCGQTAALCRQAGAQMRVDAIDVTDRSAVLQQAAAVREEFGRVNFVFCVAGVIHTGSVLGSDLDDVQHVLDVNLWGVVHTVKAFLPLVISSGGGHIVTVSSAFGLMAAPYELGSSFKPPGTKRP